MRFNYRCSSRISFDIRVGCERAIKIVSPRVHIYAIIFEPRIRESARYRYTQNREKISQLTRSRARARLTFTRRARARTRTGGRTNDELLLCGATRERVDSHSCLIKISRIVFSRAPLGIVGRFQTDTSRSNSICLTVKEGERKREGCAADRIPTLEFPRAILCWKSSGSR